MSQFVLWLILGLLLLNAALVRLVSTRRDPGEEIRRHHESIADLRTKGETWSSAHRTLYEEADDAA